MDQNYGNSGSTGKGNLSENVGGNVDKAKLHGSGAGGSLDNEVKRNERPIDDQTETGGFRGESGTDEDREIRQR